MVKLGDVSFPNKPIIIVPQFLYVLVFSAQRVWLGYFICSCSKKMMYNAVL